MQGRPLPWATLRLAAAMALAVAALSLGAMGLQYRLVSERLEMAARSALAVDLTGLAALYDQRRIISLRQAIEYRAASLPKGEMLVLLDRHGTLLAGTDGAWPAGITAQEEGFFPGPAPQDFTHQGQRWLAEARVLPGGFSLLVARSAEPMERTLAALRRGMLLLGLALVLAGGLVGTLGARSAMRRIGRLNALADRVAGGDLAARLPGPRPADEFGLLETHVHAMLDRIEALNAATLRLSDHIAHELRTPLNRLTQRLRQTRGAGDETAALEEEIRQIIRVFDALLDISRAQADQGSRGGLVPLDLSACLSEVWELYEPLAEDRGITARTDIQPGLSVLGDRNLVAQLISNLLDNAIKYCRPGDRIDLALASGPGGRILMRLCDTGPGLPPDIRDTAFDPFARGDRDRALPGHGLGLALVQAIAARHGAKIALPEVEKGFTLTIDWPRLTP